MIDDYSGLQKAAILLITLGPEKASAIFQHLKEDEIESLTLEIANTRSVSPQDKESVFGRKRSQRYRWKKCKADRSWCKVGCNCCKYYRSRFR